MGERAPDKTDSFPQITRLRGPSVGAGAALLGPPSLPPPTLSLSVSSSSPFLLLFPLSSSSSPSSFLLSVSSHISSLVSFLSHFLPLPPFSFISPHIPPAFHLGNLPVLLSSSPSSSFFLLSLVRAHVLSLLTGFRWRVPSLPSLSPRGDAPPRSSS